MKQMLMDQYLPSGCGFRVISVTDTLGPTFFQHNSADKQTHNFRTLKKWCSDNCSGIWGFSTTTKPSWNDKTGAFTVNRYFAFVDEEDILAVALFMGLEAVSIKAMWPSSTKFAIIFQE